MRTLSTDTFREIVELYASTQDLCGCIVMRNAERRRELYREIARYTMSDEFNLVRHGNVLSFRNRSRIHLLILSNRPKCMYDDVLFDETIDDLEALYHFDKLEYPPIYEGVFIKDFSEEFDKWWKTKGQFEFNDMVVEFKNTGAPDFGEFSPSQELNDFVNTLIQG